MSENGTVAAFFLQKEWLIGVEFLQSEKDDFEMTLSMGHPSETPEGGSKITQVVTFLGYLLQNLCFSVAAEDVKQKLQLVWLKWTLPYWKVANLCSKGILT